MVFYKKGLPLLGIFDIVNGEVGNTILNTRGKTGVPPSSVCNKHTGVI